jgi:hypothetical protein
MIWKTVEEKVCVILLLLKSTYLLIFNIHKGIEMLNCKLIHCIFLNVFLSKKQLDGLKSMVFQMRSELVLSKNKYDIL